jgi:NAD(P)-dependent dehydrogenase (short-subunit alcohol dehydrogenase family)
VRSCVDGFGAIDIMVNNAGITRDASMQKMAPPVSSSASLLGCGREHCWPGAR